MNIDINEPLTSHRQLAFKSFLTENNATVIPHSGAGFSCVPAMKLLDYVIAGILQTEMVFRKCHHWRWMLFSFWSLADHNNIQVAYPSVSYTGPRVHKQNLSLWNRKMDLFDLQESGSNITKDWTCLKKTAWYCSCNVCKSACALSAIFVLRKTANTSYQDMNMAEMVDPTYTIIRALFAWTHWTCKVKRLIIHTSLENVVPLWVHDLLCASNFVSRRDLLFIVFLLCTANHNEWLWHRYRK